MDLSLRMCLWCCQCVASAVVLEMQLPKVQRCGREQWKGTMHDLCSTIAVLYQAQVQVLMLHKTDCLNGAVCMFLTFETLSP